MLQGYGNWKRTRHLGIGSLGHGSTGIGLLWFMKDAMYLRKSNIMEFGFKGTKPPCQDIIERNNQST